MQINKVIEALSKKYQHNEWANTYIIKCQNEDIFETFSSEILKSLETTKENEDLILLSPKTYSIEQMKFIQSTLKFKPTSLKRKIFFLDTAQKMSEVFANKLLKVLEEPPVPCSFFLFQKSDKKLIDTICSRAISIRIDNTSHNEQVEMSKLCQDGFFSFDSKLKKDQKLEKALVNQIKYLASNSSQTSLLSKYSQRLNSDQLYYNSAQYRHFLLYRLCRSFIH